MYSNEDDRADQCRNHDNASIFADSTDRRIARGLYDTFQRAETEKAVKEFEFTLGGEAVVPGTNKTIGDYFKRRGNKYHAEAVVGEKAPTARKEKTTAASVPEKSQTKVYEASATGRRKGGPG